MVLNVKIKEQQQKLDTSFKEQLLKLDAEFRSTKEVLPGDFDATTIIHGEKDHSKLENRYAANQHSIASIEGLTEVLEELRNTGGISAGIVGGHYDKENKELVFELENGETIRFPVSDFVSGLVSQSDLEQALTKKVDKVGIANQLLGTDQTGKQTSYSIERFSGGGGGKVYVKTFKKEDFIKIGNAQKYYLQIKKVEHGLINPYVDKVLLNSAKTGEETTTFSSSATVGEKTLSTGTIKIYITVDLSKYDEYSGKIFLKGA